jgi:catechol 2,3-dioxygenase-like lactoylglutathione lyase family enzyme
MEAPVRPCFLPLLLAVALLGASLPGCGDSGGEGGAVGLVRGRVRTQDGSTLEPVTVRSGGKSAKTDRDGYFTLEVKAGGDQRIAVDSKEFAGGEAQVRVEKRGEANLELGVMRASALEVDDAEKGGRFEGADGFALKLPEKALRDARGGSSKGRAEIRYAAVGDAKLVRVAPELRSSSGQNQEQRLKSHGLVEVRFFDGDEPLRLAGEAEIEVPLPAGSKLQDGDKVGLYHYDTGKGRFESQGEAEVKDGKWVAKVDKFSWWTIAEPAEATSCINATLRTPAGRPAAWVVASAVGIDELWLSSASTNDDGEVCLEAPAGGNVALTAFWDDGDRSGEWSESALAPDQPAMCGGDCLELGDQPFSQDPPRADAGMADGGVRRDGGPAAMFEGLMETQTADTPGETLSFTFSALGGERLAYTVTSTAAAAADIVIIGPDGERIAAGSGTVTSSALRFDDAFVLPELGGEYTLQITPRSGTGTFTLDLFGVPDDAAGEISADAAPVTVSVGAVAQNAVFTFSAEGGERLAYTVDNNGDTVADLSLVGPSGNRLNVGNITVSSGQHGFRDLFELPEVAGEYRIELDPRDQGTGSFVVTLVSVPDDVLVDVTAGGPVATLAIPALAQNGAFRLRGARGGERLAYILDNRGSAVIDSLVVDPSGSNISSAGGATSAGTNRFGDAFVLPSTPGDYLFTVDPRGEAIEGSYTLRLLSVPADASVALTPGSAGSLTLPSIGQNGTFTFNANGGERFSFSVQNSADGVADFRILDPNGQTVSGSSLAVSSSATSFHDALTLPALTGTYRIEVDPRGQATGGFSVTLLSVPPDAITTTALQPYPNASEQRVTTSVAGQNAALDVTVGAANVVVAYYVTNDANDVVDTELRNPGGTVVSGSSRATSRNAMAYADVFTLGAAGTYRLLIDPRNQGTGTVGVRLFQVSPERPSASVTPGGGPTRIDLTIPGQVAAFTFALTAGQTFSYTVARTGSSVADTRLLDPSQRAVSHGGGSIVSSATPLSVSGVTAAATGTYTLEVDPRNDSTDTYNVTLTVP